MIDAVKVPCSNSIFGCSKYITYYQKEKHEKTCMHAACFCPEDGCSFEGSTGLLLNHFVTEHKWSPTNFSYDKAQRISIPRYCRFVLLVGEDQSLFLVVNKFAHIGYALTTVCVRPRESGSCYSSKISAVHRPGANKGRYVFQMDPHVASSSLHGGVQVQLGRFFLLVPPDLVDESTDELTINIHIEKIKCAVHH
jgi:E3 ubiquitin-protein ligase SIAH1